MSYRFDYKDWTLHHQKYWRQLLEQLKQENTTLKIVEVGSFEGRSSIFFADYLNETESELHCIDNWCGGEEIKRTNLSFNMTQVELNFDNNIKYHRFAERIFKHKMSSEQALLQIGYSKYQHFDHVYLDGSHTQKDTLVDLVLATTLLRTGGVIIVDDYLNNMATTKKELRPKTAVDFVADTFKDQLSFMVLPDPSYQAVFIKK